MTTGWLKTAEGLRHLYYHFPTLTPQRCCWFEDMEELRYRTGVSLPVDNMDSQECLGQKDAEVDGFCCMTQHPQRACTMIPSH